VATPSAHAPVVALSPHFHPHSVRAQYVSPVPVGVRSWGARPSGHRLHLTVGFRLSPAKWLAAVARTGRRLGTRVRRFRWSLPYRAEMKRPSARHLLDLLAALSHVADLSLGCYREDETRCHRLVLRGLLTERGARFA
jgi:hypothetical protein